MLEAAEASDGSVKVEPCTVEESATDLSVARPKYTTGQKILGILWDSLDKPPEERKLVSKIDCWVMTYVCFVYLCKYLDQQNVRMVAVCPRPRICPLVSQDS